MMQWSSALKYEAIVSEESDRNKDEGETRIEKEGTLGIYSFIKFKLNLDKLELFKKEVFKKYLHIKLKSC